MAKKLTSLDHLRMTAEKSKELSAQVASAAAEAVEELEGSKQDKLIHVEILETVCKDLRLTDSAPSYTLPAAVTLDGSAAYFCAYQYYNQDGSLDAANSGDLFSKLEGDTVNFVTADAENGVSLSAAAITDTWREAGCVSVLSIYKVRMTAGDGLARRALQQEGIDAFANGLAAHAEGDGCMAGGVGAHAEGCRTAASSDYSHAEGRQTEASGASAHAEGRQTTAGASYAHAEGRQTKATNLCAHAEGQETAASGQYTHTEGQLTKASALCAHAEGYSTQAGGLYSHAEGGSTEALAGYTHAEGYKTTAGTQASHAEGDQTKAVGWAAHAANYHTIARDYQTVVGSYNVEKASSLGDRFIVGGGDADARQNAFRVNKSGACFGAGAFNTAGADYAELFEWLDGNPKGEDRTGRFVTLDGEKIRLAGPEDGYILGIVSACPSVVGGVYDDQWNGMYLRDVFGRTILKEDGLTPCLNPDYRPEQPYMPRTERREWDAVGLLGRLTAVDDGSCQVNGWAAVGADGTATASAGRTRYRVMARLDEGHVRLMLL